MKKYIGASCLALISILFAWVLSDMTNRGKLFFTGFVFLFILTIALFKGKKTCSRKTRYCIQILWMVFLLSCNYATNIFNPKNTGYQDFQLDSEDHVMAMIAARNDGIETGAFELGRYGLGYYNTETKQVSFYSSQYGLQGKFFQLMAGIPVRNTLCCILTAVVFTMIILLIRKKYGTLLALCFFITFLLSPWIVNFARNLYWVEFTWFVPMLLGLCIGLEYENTKRFVAICAGAFISILVKSLCGYEYLSVILLAMIAFPTIDFLKSLFTHDLKKSRRIFAVIFSMGVSALLGFAFALIIHAYLRGDRNIITGLKNIYHQDVLRRTLGGNPEDFHPVYKDSLEASILAVIRKYYHFGTEIISGIPGRLFSFITVCPILIFCFKKISGKLDNNDVIMYFVFYLSCISWYILGKSHSYIHTHMNYVLWYFGFVQICFYVIAKQLLELIKSAAHFIAENRTVIHDKILGKIYG